MKVRILTKNFVIGAMRVPEGSIIELPSIAVDYMELHGTGKRVEESSDPPSPTPPKTYQRQDMVPESPVSPSVDETGQLEERQGPTRKKRTYQRRDKPRKTIET